MLDGILLGIVSGEVLYNLRLGAESVVKVIRAHTYMLMRSRFVIKFHAVADIINGRMVAALDMGNFGHLSRVQVFIFFLVVIQRTVAGIYSGEVGK